MSIFDYFLRKKNSNTSASIAKERLQVIVAHERNKRTEPEYLEKMRQEILEVIRKYIKIDTDDVSVQLENNNDCSVLELNVVLPE